MKALVALWPGSNCDRDAAAALSRTGWKVTTAWHTQTSIPQDVDLVLLPGGFSHGDYLRCGAVASRSPLMSAIKDFAKRGGYVLGICNGFQILTESGLLPGALVPNSCGHFLCRDVLLQPEGQSLFVKAYANQPVTFPIAHNDGRFVADDETLARLEGEGQIAFRYLREIPNGSSHRIAGITSQNGRVLGLMPHPERATDPLLGGTDGLGLFLALREGINV